MDCFAHGGFHGTNLDEIVAKAKVNKRMIYHYFGGKNQLYRAAHEEVWNKLTEWYGNLIQQPRDFSSISTTLEEYLMLEAVKALHDFVAMHPLFRRLVIWDAIEGGKVTRSLWREIREPLYQHFVDFLIATEKQGVIPTNLRADHLIVSIMGIVTIYFLYANSLFEVFGKNPLSQEAIAERKEQVVYLCQKLLMK